MIIDILIIIHFNISKCELSWYLNRLSRCVLFVSLHIMEVERSNCIAILMKVEGVIVKSVIHIYDNMELC